MIVSIPPYRLLASFSLLLLFLLPLGMKEAHLLLEEHEPHPVCEASGADQHLHGEEMQHHDCSLCLLSYTQFLEFEAVEGSYQPIVFADIHAFHYSFSPNHPALSHIRERGPPCFAFFA